MDNCSPPPISHININMEVANPQLHQKLDHRQGCVRLVSLEDTRSLEKKEDGVFCYSAINALTGLTDEALRAGIKLASTAEKPSTAATAASVEKSHG